MFFPLYHALQFHTRLHKHYIAGRIYLLAIARLNHSRAGLLNAYADVVYTLIIWNGRAMLMDNIPARIIYKMFFFVNNVRMKHK